jgi:hypothetical protein
MKGITYTQVAQYCVLIIAYTIPAIFISLQLTGNPIPGLGLFSNMNEGLPGGIQAGVPLLTTLDGLLTDLGFSEYTATTNPWLMALYTLSLMIGTAGLPHVIIRFFTVPKRCRRTLVRRLGAGLHRTAVPHGSGCGCHGAPEHHHHHVARRCRRAKPWQSKTCPTGSAPGRSPACSVSKT